MTQVDPVFAVLGVETLGADHLLAFARRENTQIPREWVELYARLAPEAGIRTSIAFAQAVKETNYFRFTGDARPEWNNPAGLGVGGGTRPDGEKDGNRFQSREAGVRAHLGHILWYFGPHAPAFCDLDQRHFGSHKGLANNIRLLSGKWAVPGVGYGESIAQIATDIRTLPVPATPGLWDARPDDTLVTLGDLRGYARTLAEQLAKEYVHK